MLAGIRDWTKSEAKLSVSKYIALKFPNASATSQDRLQQRQINWHSECILKYQFFNAWSSELSPSHKNKPQNYPWPFPVLPSNKYETFTTANTPSY